MSAVGYLVCAQGLLALASMLALRKATAWRRKPHGTRAKFSWFALWYAAHCWLWRAWAALAYVSLLVAVYDGARWAGWVR